MSRVFVHGIGAVSPAGWGVGPLRDALANGEPLPAQPVVRAGWRRPLLHRPVPAPAQRPVWIAHPRLRRTSPISHYAMAAAAEALGPRAEAVARGELQLGVIVCVMAGPVNYSRRFYDETLQNPTTASPLVFPETVFNAPASHLAAVLGTTAVNYTLVGDPGTFLQGLALAAEWMDNGRIQQCLIVGAEESDWITASAAALFTRDAVVSAGAGAVLLGTGDSTSALAELDTVTDAFTYTDAVARERAEGSMQKQIGRLAPGELLCDSLTGLARYDAAEGAAWRDHSGARTSPRIILGEGFAAASAWQCVVAVDGVARGHHPAAVVSIAGANQQAIGARFIQAAV
jgi:3-Oxoacyl-[acyl-carrier-protein (ACP)] synthase III